MERGGARRDRRRGFSTRRPDDERVARAVFALRRRVTQRFAWSVAGALVLVAVVLAALLATERASAGVSAASADSIRFSFVVGAAKGPSAFSMVGSGRLTLLSEAHIGRWDTGTSAGGGRLSIISATGKQAYRMIIDFGGSSGAFIAYTPNGSSAVVKQVRLVGRVVLGTGPAQKCENGRVDILVGYGPLTGGGTGGAGSFAVSCAGGKNLRAHGLGKVTITEQCTLQPRMAATAEQVAGCGSQQPTVLTLMVNGTTGTAFANAPLSSTHPTAPQVAPNSALTIKAMIDHPLPAGWRLIVFHNGDPKSTGNGNYYTVCEIDGSASNTQTSCGDTRPTLPSPGDDFVGAQVQSPQGLVFNIQIYVPVR
jgi:hypothetical protein